MQTLERTNCAICDSTELEVINEFPNFPIMNICNDGKGDLFYNKCPVLCKKCCCIQLKYLIDASVLYSSIYMISTFSPSWLIHNTKLADFILQNTDSSSLLEIGANKGGLFKIISKQRKINYTVLDMYREAELPSEVQFLQGNCETFDFNGINTVILSHVFEHLLNPIAFVKMISKAKVNEVFISNPNFDHFLDTNNITTIYSQHTFYCGFDHLIYMFSLYKYRCEAFYRHNGVVKSLMFKFAYDPLVLPKALPYIHKDIFTNLYVKRINHIKNLEVPPNSVVCPSGTMGQYLYYFITKKENVLGFIDNNPERQNKILYGTGKTVFLPKDLDLSNVTVLLADSFYNDEIIAGLKALCATVKIIIV